MAAKGVGSGSKFAAKNSRNSQSRRARCRYEQMDRLWARWLGGRFDPPTRTFAVDLLPMRRRASADTIFDCDLQLSGKAISVQEWGE